MYYEPQYGANRIRVKTDEYNQHLDDYLTNLGIRSRIVEFHGNELVIESDNPYMTFDKRTADNLMSVTELTKYKLQDLAKSR